MKKFLVYSLCAVAVLCVAGAALFYGFAGSYIDKRVVKACEAAYGSAPEFLEKSSTSLFPLAINFGKFRWRLKSSGYEVNIEAKNLKIELEWTPLISGEARFREILLDSPRATLARTGDKTPAAAKNDPEGRSASIYIERLVVRDGELEYDDSGRRFILKNIKVAASNIDLKKGADLKGDFILSIAASGKEAALEGNLAFKSNIQYYRPYLSFRQTSITFSSQSENSLSALSPIKLNLDGALNIDAGGARVTEATLSSPQGNLRLRGEMSSDFKSFAGEARAVLDLAKMDRDFGLSAPEMEAIVSSPIEYRYPEIALDALALRVGETQGEGRLRIKLPIGKSPLSIEGETTCGIIRLGSFPAPDSKGSEKSQRKSEGGDGIHPDINFAFKASGLDYKKLNLKNISFNIKGGGGNYAIPDLKFDWEGGSINASIKLKTPDFLWNFNASGKNINFGAMLANFGIEGFENGLASFQARLDAKGAVPRAIATSVSGDGQFHIAGLRIKIIEEVARALTFFTRDSINSGGISADAPFVAKNGVVNFANLSASSKVASANGSVSIDFVKNFLDSLIRFHVGGLKIPLKIAGEFDHVSVSLDAGKRRR